MKIKDILRGEDINNKKLALCNVLNLSLPLLVLNKDRELSSLEYDKYCYIFERLEEGVPIQYVVCKANFYGRDFFVDENVLIPRPETEVLVEDTYKLIKEKFEDEELNILDIGTGSGVIAITLSLFSERFLVVATDISEGVLGVARKNQDFYNSKVSFKRTNLYEGINKKFDVVVSNPPYIENDSCDVEKIVKDNEPSLALYGGVDGLDYYREILKNIKEIIKEKHIIAFEIGDGQGEKIKKMVSDVLPFDDVVVKKDYNGFDRYVYVLSKD